MSFSTLLFLIISFSLFSFFFSSNSALKKIKVATVKPSALPKHYGQNSIVWTLFPAFLLGVDGFKALKAVLPPGLPTYAVGGVDPINFADWLACGVRGFGIGSYLYKVGDNVSDVGKKAKIIVSAYDDASYERT